MKHRNKVKLPSRPIDLLKTDVAATFARVRRQMAEEAKKTNVVRLKRHAKP